ncbi:hypothetical protein BDU57DRAFT_185253 [Ampelomyces quisqualis]|uniref:Uncharacterized protein n=1 Tax=Ampelomyces quisqualis TaxID=50730 RepID=A0A6A5QRR0_AMPQU|nr:hypothetical protein BDU57DRAFT_185253 [Ampelomyces quisqualis]
MRLLHAQQALVGFAACIPAFTVRDSPLNGTTTASLDLPPANTASTSAEPEPEFPTSRQHRPHLEVSESGFDRAAATKDATRSGSNAQTTRPAQPDIGSIIQSFLTTALTVGVSQPSDSIEKSDEGWTIATPTPEAGPHFEASTDGFGHATNHDFSRPQVTAPGRGVTPLPYVHIPIVTPPPAITQGGLTLQPVPVTSVRVTTVDGRPTTLEAAINYHYVAGSDAIPIGAPRTINDVVVAISIDAAGSTVLAMGDLTTTLPAPVRGAQATQALALSTTAVDGTTKYILAGQTLAPGQAITIGNVPISIGTIDGGATVLVMGDVSTTFGAAWPAVTDFSASAPAQPGVQSGSARDGQSAASTSANRGAPRKIGWLLTKFVGVAAFVQPLV